MPYISIKATPKESLSNNKDTVKITINGVECDEIEYSFDGISYFPYTGAFIVDHPTKVFGRGINQYGTTIKYITITTEAPTAPKINLDIFIRTEPDKSEVKKRIGSVKVTIDYDSRATRRIYKVGDHGNWEPYTGPFNVDKNATIYAYATCNRGEGSALKNINFLVDGIADPVIKIDPETLTDVIKVEIEYDETAETKQYKIGNGKWVDYEGSFYVEENCTIYARNIDEFGHVGTAERTITNYQVYFKM